MWARALILITALLLCFRAAGAEIKPVMKDNKLGANLTAVKFPERLSKDLLSGLSNKILARFELSSDSGARLEKVTEVTVKYDLWDENFNVQTAVGDETAKTQTISTLKETLDFLTNLRVPDLWSADDVPSAGTWTIKVDMLLNPIEKEQMEKIRKWVTQNSTSAPLNPSIPGSTKPIAASRSNTLFNKIFEQYASGANLASAWRLAVASRPFSIAELKAGGSK